MRRERVHTSQAELGSLVEIAHPFDSDFAGVLIESRQAKSSSETLADAHFKLTVLSFTGAIKSIVLYDREERVRRL